MIILHVVISSNEAPFRILSFPIHDRSLAVHLENGQRVYFTIDNAQQIAERPPSTTLVSFLNYVKEIHLLKQCFISKYQHITSGMQVQRHGKNEKEEHLLKVVLVGLKVMQ